MEGLNAAEAASDAAFPARVIELAAHTRAHVAREDAIMDETGFFAAEMHQAEHREGSPSGLPGSSGLKP